MDRKTIRTLVVGLFLLTVSMTQAQAQQVDMDKPTTRPIPKWFNEAKFGIFVVWGPYSVPSYSHGGYAEWYWKHSQSDSASKAFHEKVYGKDFPYEKFADEFKPVFFDPDAWCELFAKSGARYVITTANYHDGYAMYPTDYALTVNTKDWNSMVRGPRRDLIGDLNVAGEKHGLKMGIYYSLYEWYHPWYLENREKFVNEWFHNKFKEVVTRYKPWSIFLDGDWEMSHQGWKSEELASWLYNESNVKDVVVVNDRWGNNTRGVYGDVLESEYGGGKYTSARHPWQEDRGIGKSYGYNRNESIYDYDSRETLIRRISEVAGGGGNFLLDVGPTADGRIPVIMQERLLQIGEWMKINGEAIYGTDANPFWPRLFDWGTLTAKPGKLYIHIHDPQRSNLTIPDFRGKVTRAVLLSTHGSIPVKYTNRANSFSASWNKLYNDKAVTIIELDLAGDLSGSTLPGQFADGTLEFNAWAMKIHGQKARVSYNGYINNLKIADWNDPGEYVTAEFVVKTPGTYQLSLVYQAHGNPEASVENQKGNAGSEFVVETGGKIFRQKTRNTANKFETVPVGTVRFNAGTQKIKIAAAPGGYWKEFNLQGVHIEPVGSSK